MKIWREAACMFLLQDTSYQVLTIFSPYFNPSCSKKANNKNVEIDGNLDF